MAARKGNVVLKKAAQTHSTLSRSDAAAIRELMLRFTTTEVPAADLPSACSEVRDDWLSGFRESICKNFEAHCSDDSLAPPPQLVSTNDLDALGARLMVSTESLKDIRAQVIQKRSALEGSHLEKRRKLAEVSVDVASAETMPLVQALNEKTLRDLKAAVEKAVAITAVHTDLEAKEKALRRTMEGVERSMGLRAGGAVEGSDPKGKKRKGPAPAVAHSPSTRFAEHLSNARPL